MWARDCTAELDSLGWAVLGPSLLKGDYMADDLENDELVEEIEAAEAEPDAVEVEEIDPDQFYQRNAFRVVYQTNNFLLPQIADLISSRKVINIRPEYQRRLRWHDKQKSRLIESLLLNIPIPPVFFFESEAAEYEVMDGQQRLNAIKEFLNNEFALKGLTILWPLNGYSYSQLPPRISRNLKRAVISAITLLLESDVEEIKGKGITNSDVRRFIFDRLNTGGKPLNAQELRNAIFPGFFNEAIINITRNRTFTTVWNIPHYTEADPNDYYENPRRQRNRLYSTMADCEIVLRYLALSEPEHIRGAMRNILDDCMRRKRDLPKEAAAKVEERYIERLELANEMFDGAPFEIPRAEGEARRKSVALQDAVMVACDRLWEHREELKEVGPEIQEALDDLALDEDKGPILIGRANTSQAIKDRLNLVEGVFLAKLGR
jgi:hypothetical protein